MRREERCSPQRRTNANRSAKEAIPREFGFAANRKHRAPRRGQDFVSHSSRGMGPQVNRGTNAEHDEIGLAFGSKLQDSGGGLTLPDDALWRAPLSHFFRNHVV